LMKYGTAQRALLGVGILDVSQELAESLDIEFPVEQGVYIRSVNENSGGEDAGLKVGDIIISVDGRATNNVANLQELVARKRPGDKVDVEYIRDGKTITTNATLKNFSGTTDIVEKVIPITYEFEGVRFEEIPERVKSQLELSGGAVIAAVNGQKWRNSGARTGFIITSIINENGRVRITNVDKLLEVLKETEGDPIVVLGMFQDGTEYYFEVN
ncbi:MAG: PDZ domain-containing protein, partial [Algoriphagus sp.]